MKPILLPDELPQLPPKIYVLMAVQPWGSLKDKDGDPLIIAGGPVGFLPVFESLEELRKFSEKGDYITVEAK